ncbi:hypothetical protein ACE1B6_11485 [Aerosakkonemataceae cyanobacterium BLCC-F154]|uniref:Uncharacterized protein n=1 Tax=Floridaenema fluviatile BLCC-F154 TaxID=3153640 RepID=A0ABV4YD92_9CYAN
MLDISFYTANGETSYHVEVAENFLEWLARSEFAKIGEEKPVKIAIDGEKETLPLVKLGKNNRKKLIEFFNDSIINETKEILNQLGESLMKNEKIYRLQKLIELLDCIKNEKYQYLQRI